MPPENSTSERLAHLEARLDSHFTTVERDRSERRETERELTAEIKVLSQELSEMRDMLRAARLSGKILVGVATTFGALVAWIVGLYRGH